MTYQPVDITTNTIPVTKEHYYRGLELISQGKAALITLAGGQGSRLGFEHPKGMFVLPFEIPKSIFQMTSERLLRLQELASEYSHQKNVMIHWFLMTNEETIEEINNYFKEHQYFGLSSEQIHCFPQGMLPVVDFNGKILYEKKDKPYMAPNGHGGLFKALKDNGILEFMNEKGIKYSVAHNVDNILCKDVDPNMIGYMDLLESEVCIKIVKKGFKEEKVGVLVKEQERIKVVEYTELTDELNKQLSNGEFIYNCGHISINGYSTPFLEKAAEYQLPYHIAKKKVPFIDEQGIVIHPSENNGIKKEMFFFDAFPLATKVSIFEIQRFIEFSALKNSLNESFDNVNTVKRDWYRLNVYYLQKAGAIVDDSKSPICEISFRRSFEEEGLKEFKGKTIQLPFILQ
ncbi:hypothetical protein ENUP19_0079G0031 [Entamoeba nuttalli]|uniref:UDP-N-acetylglucosamine diphosphorylase n=1 Tax=Entamoeba nuttalli TaxID=412467 RepID=A0ABQ0DEU0_9EUKA